MDLNTPPPPSIPIIPKSKNTIIWYIPITLLVLLLTASIGWNIYLLSKQSSTGNQTAPPSSASNIFETQNAFITGEITGINGNRVTITNKAGSKGELRVADNISINDLNENTATPSSDLKSIKTNKLANINAQVIKDEYQVTSITYIQQATDLITLPPVTNPPSIAPSTASESAKKP